MLTCMKTVYRNIRPDLIEGVDVHVSMVPEDNEEPEVEPSEVKPKRKTQGSTNLKQGPLG